MKWILAAVAAWTLLAGASQATTVSFTSSAQLSCGANATCTAVLPNQLSFASTLLGGPSLTLTYNPGGDTQDAPPAASANFGSLFLACAGCTTANAAAWSLVGVSAVVTFLQTLPFAGSNGLPGSFSSAGLGWSGPSGTNGAQTGSAVFTWSAGGTTIADGVGQPIGYETFVPSVLLQLGNNSIQGLVLPVPEPSSLALLAAGLLALRRHRRS
jgi:hypothetical protein